MTLSAETKDRFEGLVREHLTVPLRAAGYRKARYTWWRLGSPVGSVVDVQRMPNQGDEPMSFTINWGIYVVGYEELAWSRNQRATPKPYTCPIAGRIAAFTDDRDQAI